MSASVRVGGADCEHRRAARVRRRVRRLSRSPHGLALVRGHRRRSDGRRGRLEPGLRRARRAGRERAHRVGRRRAARGGARRSFAADLSAVGGLRFTRVVGARGPQQPAGDAQRLPPAVRLVLRRATGWAGARVWLRCHGVARRALVTAITACLLLAGCGGGDSSDDSGGQSGRKPLLGVTTGALTEPDAPLAEEVKAMREAGVTALRAPFYWTTAQPQGKPPTSRATDPLVAAAAREQIELLPIVLGTPSWAASHPELGNSPPAGTKNYAAFLTDADRPLRAFRVVLEGAPRRAQAADPSLADLERARPPPLLVRPALRRAGTLRWRERRAPRSSRPTRARRS